MTKLNTVNQEWPIHDTELEIENDHTTAYDPRMTKLKTGTQEWPIYETELEMENDRATTVTGDSWMTLTQILTQDWPHHNFDSRMPMVQPKWRMANPWNWTDIREIPLHKGASKMT